MSVTEPIAIVGIGCRMPGKVGSPEDMWRLLAGGVDAIVEVPDERWCPSSVYHSDPSKPGKMNTRWGGFLDHIDRFDAQFFGISPREAERADPQQRQLLEVAYQAVEDAGLTLAALARKRASVYIGISTWDYSLFQSLSDERTAVNAYTNLGTSLSIAANRISYFFNLVGPSLAVDTACSSSLVAVHLACRSIWSGESELAFAGGVNAMLRPETTLGFSKASMLSPDGRCKSFDSRANGYVRSEGVGVVILKPLTRALEDGDRIYAMIRGTAVNQDGRTAGISVPNESAQRENIIEALRFADIAPESVQYVEAHGTGTPVGDPIEAAALGAVYGKVRTAEAKCVIGSVKGNIGHLEAAAGIAGLIKVALCLHHRQIPASLHFQNPSPQIAFDELRLRVAQRLEPWCGADGSPLRAGVNSFGFGGTNAHAILEAAPPLRRVQSKQADGRAWTLPLSARSPAALLDLGRSYLSALQGDDALRHESLREISFSAAVKRSHHEFRLALVAHDKVELAEQLEAFLRDEGGDYRAGRAFGIPPKPVFVCSGMGQQWWGMGRELLADEPVFREAIEEVSDLFSKVAGWSLLDQLSADEKISRMQETCVGQPAIFALQVALSRLWQSWGIEPSAVVGHSAGEMAAAYIAGALSLEDATRVTFHRSRLQHRTAGQGAMLAVGISWDEAMCLVEQHSQDISVAAVNGPRSVTLSGNAAVLVEIDNALNEAGKFSRALRVDVPFHSSKMEQLQPELIECLRDIRPQSASVPFLSTVTGTALAGHELNALYWYRNIRQPVLFHMTMQALIEAGHKVFLEIGAHPILRRDIVECLNEKSWPGTTLSSLRREARERAAMLGSLGQLYTLGANIDWHRLYPTEVSAIKLPLYPFQAERHWRESETNRRARVGRPVHPLLGNRLDVPKPSWKVDLNSVDLTYLDDHRIGDSVVFPGAGYVEMALAAARETFGSVACVVESLEFQKLLVLDQNGTFTVQVVLDPESSEFDVYVRADAADSDWDLHARGSVRQDSPAIPCKFDLAQIRKNCGDEVGGREYYRRLHESGYKYGPMFQGITQLWRSEREVLAEIQLASGLNVSSYLLHPVALDACFHTIFAGAPTRMNGKGPVGGSFVPMRIERVQVHAVLGTRFFAYTRLANIGSTELKADLHVLDEAGNSLVDVQGLIARQIGNHVEKSRSALYEHQWKLSRFAESRGPRDAGFLTAPELLAPVLEHEAIRLWQRFNRARFQDEFAALFRATAAAYIMRALRELGWTPELFARTPIDALTGRLGIVPLYDRWLENVLRELSADEMNSSSEPGLLWAKLWNAYPECLVEVRLLRRCGENLSAALRGELDLSSFVFSEDALPTMEHLYRDSETLRVSNLLVQNAVAELVRRLPKGRALRVLEIGGGTGAITSFVVPVLAENCAEYVFTDASPRFITDAQHKFDKYPFMRFQHLDLEREPLEQDFKAHSFDLIIASCALHATKNLRDSVQRVRQLLGSNGILLILEPTRPSLATTLIFGLFKNRRFFSDDARQYGPCITPEDWKRLLCDATFCDVISIADCPDVSKAQYSIILARSPQLRSSPVLSPKSLTVSQTWLLFVDDGNQERTSAGAELARQLRARGDLVIEVMHRASFEHAGDGRFNVCAGDPDDLKRLMGAVRLQATSLAGIVHLWSLDIETKEMMTSTSLMSSAKLGCVGALQLTQAIEAADGLVVEGIWLVTRLAQSVANQAGALQIAQSPMWGFSRVAGNEYQNICYRTVDVGTSSRTEIESLVEEMIGGDRAEEEIALRGELKYVRRLVPISVNTVQGMGRPPAESQRRFRFEVMRPGILGSLRACSIQRTVPKSNEVEIEVVTVGLNFKDLMLAMGMLPKDGDDSSGQLLGLECAGRVVSVGDDVRGFSPGDEVIAVGTYCLASHICADVQFVSHKPRHMSFEQAATIPVAFSTAFYSLHTLAQMKPGERVLIHSATGGVGLAAVQLALRAGAIVFATAGTPEKRELLSALGVPYVMDSRSLAFGNEVLKLTQGEGVDIVLNSLAGEAIDKSLSILRSNGRFIEIGKVDIYKNRKLGMRPFSKSISLSAVDLSNAWAQRSGLPRTLMDEVLGLFESKDLRPLAHRVFPAASVAEALRYMGQAKHVGKLIISMQDSWGLQVDCGSTPKPIDANGSYIVTGGLGGLGLAVAERLVQRGARHLALVGRSGPSTSAQTAVEALRRQGAEVMICQADITERRQTQQIITSVQHSMGPLRGIVHAAMVLDDAPIEHLNEERMWRAMAPKVLGAWNLHALTLDIPLDFFVLFSSIASIVGNPGQANYVAGNTFLDTLAYFRRAQNLPALAVNWGAIGEVGHVAKSPETAHRLERLGVKAIPLLETLDTLDELMFGDAVQITVAQVEWKTLLGSIGSRTPARYGNLGGDSGTEAGSPDANVGIRELLDASEAALPSLLESYIRDLLARAMATSPTRIDTQQSLRNLGIDSLIAVEARNRINTDLGLKIPLATVMQSENIKSLAAFVAEQLIESKGGEQSKRPDRTLDSAEAPLTGVDAAHLLERIDQMTDEEIERHLTALQPQGQA